ncbi:hypothetical protein SanJ4206_0515c [Streptococcus anginosus]|nr:hypothetical protein SanJ4206_0515c [Streptococcus anginosus]
MLQDLYSFFIFLSFEVDMKHVFPLQKKKLEQKCSASFVYIVIILRRSSLEKLC